MVISPDELMALQDALALGTPAPFVALLPFRKRAARAGVLHLGEYTFRVSQGREAITAALADEWDLLWQRAAPTKPFVSPEWVRTWLGIFAPEAEVIVVQARHQGVLCGVIPLVRERIGPRALGVNRLMAPFNLHTVQCDVLAMPALRDEVLSGIWRYIRTTLGWDVIDYRNTPETGGFATIATLGAAAGHKVIVRRVNDSPVIPLNASTSIETLGPAKKLRKLRRQLMRDGEYGYRQHRYPTDEVIDRFLEVEASGWKREQGTAIALHDDLERYYRAVMRQSTGPWIPVIHELLLDDVVIAVALGVEAGTSWYELKSAYRETHRQYGPGHVLMWEVANDLLARGMQAYELLGQMEPYKALWTSETQPNCHYLLFQRSPYGAMLGRLASVLIPAITQWRARRASQAPQKAGTPATRPGTSANSSESTMP